MADYFASRILMDEGVIKSYIKEQRSEMLEWLKRPLKPMVNSNLRKFNMYWSLLQSIKGKLNRPE